MNTSASYPIHKTSINQANVGLDINKLISNGQSTSEETSAASTAISSTTDLGGRIHQAMDPSQKANHIDGFKKWLLERVEEIEKRSRNPVAKDEKGRDLFSVFDFADLFVILDTLAGCMPPTPRKNSEGARFANFVTSYFPPMNEKGDTISFANAKYLYSAGRCGLLHNLGDSTDKKPAKNPLRKLSYTHGPGKSWAQVDVQNGGTEFTLYANEFCSAVKQAISKAFAVDSFRSGVNQRLGRQDWIVVVN